MVYIDPDRSVVMFPTMPSWRFRFACHLVADSLEELHAFAARLGLRRSWFQDRQDLPHYDITQNKRRVALKLGAQEISHRELVGRMHAARESRRGNGDHGS